MPRPPVETQARVPTRYQPWDLRESAFTPRSLQCPRACWPQCTSEGDRRAMPCSWMYNSSAGSRAALPPWSPSREPLNHAMGDSSAPQSQPGTPVVRGGAAATSPRRRESAGPVRRGPEHHRFREGCGSAARPLHGRVRGPEIPRGCGIRPRPRRKPPQPCHCGLTISIRPGCSRLGLLVPGEQARGVACSRELRFPHEEFLAR